MTGPHHTNEITHSLQSHELLADTLRPQLLFELAQHDEPLDVDALAETLTERRTGSGHELARVSETTSTMAELHHCHLPKLDEAGWIEYDDECQTVRLESTNEALYARLQRTIQELERIQSVFEDAAR